MLYPNPYWSFDGQLTSALLIGTGPEFSPRYHTKQSYRSQQRASQKRRKKR